MANPICSSNDQDRTDTDVGTDIRALRKSRSMTLIAFAEALDRSVGFVSQIERGLSEPSISDLRSIAELFDVPISFFFGVHNEGPENENHIVRAGYRRQLGNREEGLLEELLSPDLGGSFEVIRSEFAPGSQLFRPQKRETEEAGFVVSGSLELELEGRWNKLEEGDSFRFSAIPYRWRNLNDCPAVVVWVVSPPCY